jgi:MoxR-like ATPase
MTVGVPDITEAARAMHRKFHLVKEEIHNVIVGQSRVITRLLIALLADQHVLLEGLPGVAKSMMVTTLAQVAGCSFKRIQFTPDLLPADLVGTVIYNPKDAVFSVKKGPLFTHIVLADEINRAPAKVQSALLEAMAERHITIGGKTFPLEKPFFVLATQNPVEHEGTYSLPEAQTDRFMMKVKVHYPSREEELKIVERMATLGDIPEVEAIIDENDIAMARAIVDDIYIDEKIVEYILNIIFATRQPHIYVKALDGMLEYGASPRATIAVIRAAKGHAFLSGRSFVSPHDVISILYDVMAHRLRLTYEAEAEGYTPEIVIKKIIDTIPLP